MQSSLNGASLYTTELHLPAAQKPGSPDGGAATTGPSDSDWKLGAANASPFFFAALVGCPLSLPVNHLIGRRGAMFVAAVLIFASSLGAAWCRDWKSLFGVRVINGLGKRDSLRRAQAIDVQMLTFTRHGFKGGVK